MKKLEIIAKVLQKLGLTDHYPDAGENAQPEVKRAITRFKEEGHTDDILLYWLLGEGTPDYKMPKNLATYKEKSEVDKQKCANCEFAYQKVHNKQYICSQVEGDISPGAWCRLWTEGKK
jgi:hypothetical protein